ncbi:hypothetical protein DFH08DRAFT_789912 [Mycena albidolilacea]|uniref:F-box domain-containing protein n=1 Tax=Mycena albidolilacea TaxID=1033008 RepID=A0AAD6ZCU1_9AGAR|nr:hypothetical protein DFH08DRAFT_789912 [Mycena albidolilacea]
MTATLPQELIDAILDHLAGDPPSLKACSLVSCAWVPCTRLHLFKTCTLNPRTVSDFSGLLRSPHCTFRLHIRSIHLPRDIPTSTLHNKFDDPAFAVDLRGLTGVRALELTLNTRPRAPCPTVHLRTWVSSRPSHSSPVLSSKIFKCVPSRRSSTRYASSPHCRSYTCGCRVPFCTPLILPSTRHWPPRPAHYTPSSFAGIR